MELTPRPKIQLNTFSFTIALSEIKKTVESRDDHFLCHALSFCSGTSWEFCTIDENLLAEEIFRVIGSKYQHQIPGLFLEDWLKELPGHLREIQDGEHRIMFRKKFLQWMINKFGDQKIKVRCKLRGNYGSVSFAR